MKNILITGGSGLIGSRLTRLLRAEGYSVSHLSRTYKPTPGVKVYTWNIDEGYIEPGAIDTADAIIHLAGEGIADKRWTKKRKQDLIESRVKSAELLYTCLSNTSHTVKTFISASAVGYYSDRGESIQTEDMPASPDFLGTCCQEWEESTGRFTKLGMRVVQLRTGTVLSDKGGALPFMAKLTRAGLGTALGSGKQWMSWIHLDDLCNMYVYALKSGHMQGPYNAAAIPVRNREFSKELAHVLQRPFFLPAVPAFILRLVMGEMSAIVLGSTRVSNEKIREAGFQFQYPHLKKAFHEIYAH